MCAYEERIKAVNLYIKLENKSSEVKGILGYPTKKYVQRWYLRYIEEGDLLKTHIRLPRFTAAQKQKVLEHYVNNGRCGTLRMKSLGYPYRALVKRWLDE
jgi:hypothetical protein